MNELQELLKARSGLSQSYIAKELQVSNMFVSLMVSGKKKIPARHLPTIKKIAKEYGYTIEETVTTGLDD